MPISHKRMKKKKIILTFLFSFIGWFVGFVFLLKTGSSRGIGPLSWQKIYDDLYIILLISFFVSIVFSIGYLIIIYENKDAEKTKRTVKRRATNTTIQQNHNKTYEV